MSNVFLPLIYGTGESTRFPPMQCVTGYSSDSIWVEFVVTLVFSERLLPEYSGSRF